MNSEEEALRIESDDSGEESEGKKGVSLNPASHIRAITVRKVPAPAAQIPLSQSRWSIVVMIPVSTPATPSPIAASAAGEQSRLCQYL